MKAQFKHAFFSGLNARGGVFAVIFVINLTFIILGSLGLLPDGVKITAVSLGGVAVAVMIAANMIGGVSIIRQMFVAPGAYLYALTPTPRKNMLLASVIAMAVMDVITMVIVIIQEVWLSLLLVGDDMIRDIWDTITAEASKNPSIVVSIGILITGYLLILMIILFCVAAKKSLFYQKPAGGLMTALLAIALGYVVSLTPLLLAPMSAVSRLGIFFTVNSNSTGAAIYALLLFLESAVLFVLTARLMERKINI